MAQMYPYQLSADTKSAAEKKLYEVFRDQLDESYVVFHGVRWQSIDHQGQPRDGEADFVLAHPERGVLVLEVKGGGIRRDPRTKIWISLDGGGQEHILKDPVEQATRSRHALIDALRRSLKRYVPIGHAIAFPGVIIGQMFLGMDLPRQIVLDATDLPQVTAWMEHAFEYWNGHHSFHKPFGKDGLRSLLSLMGKQWELRPVLWGSFCWNRRS